MTNLINFNDLSSIPKVHASPQEYQRQILESLAKGDLPKVKIVKRAATWAEILELYRATKAEKNCEEFKKQFLAQVPYD